MDNGGHVNFKTIESALIAGASGGIGTAFVTHLLGLNQRLQLFATYRSNTNAQKLFDIKEGVSGSRLDLIQLSADKEDDYQNLAQRITDHGGKIDAVINCIGYLHGESGKPEKRLTVLEMDHIRESFCVNSIPVIMFAKYLFPLLKNPSPSIFASLSARVGSIGDNRSGGWYSYRASKSAHNMFLRSIALELERFGCNTLTIALHPGTTETKLSKPFIANTRYKLHSPEQTAANLLRVMSEKSLGSNGGFFDWEGKPIEW